MPAYLYDKKERRTGMLVGREDGGYVLRDPATNKDWNCPPERVRTPTPSEQIAAGKAKAERERALGVT